ncbi:MAG TPA: hypothetical protein VJ965_09025 [Anaerolineales bacterium]|nr:hypothetical protein [Anaerolineales bacterium]
MFRTPTVRAYLPLIVVLLFMGWGGLFILVNMTQPTIWPRWIFYFLVVVAFTGVSLPVAVYLNRRFSSDPYPGSKVMVRQSLWVGVYIALMVWMNFGQVVSFGLAALFLVGFTGIEIFLRLRETSRWRRP